MRAREELQKKNGREPKISEIAAQVGQSPENVAMALESAVTPTSLYEPIYSDGEDSFAVVDQLRDATGEESWISDMMFRDTVRALSARERRIIALRYLGGKTQTQVAREIGISQAQVSRLEKAALSRIKRRYAANKKAHPPGCRLAAKQESRKSVHLDPARTSARVKDFGFLYRMPVMPRLYAAWALAFVSSTKIVSSYARLQVCISVVKISGSGLSRWTSQEQRRRQTARTTPADAARPSYRMPYSSGNTGGSLHFSACA